MATRLQGAVADKAPWTPEEDEKLRAAHAEGGYMAAYAVLPERSRCAVKSRAHRLGCERAFRHWTQDEDRKLHEWWGEGLSLQYVARKLPGRTRRAIFTRAMRLGLYGVPQGYEYIHLAAERCGVSVSLLEKLMRQRGLRVGYAFSQPHRGKGLRQRRVVDSLEAEETVQAWLQTEPVTRAAERHGVGEYKLRHRLHSMGIRSAERGQHLLVSEEQIAQALAGETVAQAARRVGMGWRALRRRLLMIGVEWQSGPPKHLRLTPEQVEAALAIRLPKERILLTLDGRRVALREACRLLGKRYETVRRRMRLFDLTPEVALGLAQRAA